MADHGVPAQAHGLDSRTLTGALRDGSACSSRQRTNSSSEGPDHLRRDAALGRAVSRRTTAISTRRNEAKHVFCVTLAATSRRRPSAGVSAGACVRKDAAGSAASAPAGRSRVEVGAISKHSATRGVAGRTPACWDPRASAAEMLERLVGRASSRGPMESWSYVDGQPCPSARKPNRRRA